MAQRAQRSRPSKRKGRRRSRGRRTLRQRVLRALFLGGGLLVVFSVLATALPVALLRVVAPPTTAFMVRSRWEDPATGRACPRVAYAWVPWSRISPQLARAVLVAEDQRFLEHGGFDTKAIGAAVDDFVDGGRLRGASTISQQVAKNLFLWPGRSPLRKGLEAWITLFIETLWPKRRTLEVYVNTAQFGPCLFGAQAAAEGYFDRPASELSAIEAARLAAVLPAPGRYRVEEPGPWVLERSLAIYAEMNRGGGPGYLRGLDDL